MSIVEAKKFEPQSGTDLNLGASGDGVILNNGVTLKTNTFKDSGGNTLWASDGAGTLSSVNSGLQGGMSFISSQPASSSASLSFTSGIDSTYDEYIFYLVNINPATDNQDFQFQVSTDGGSSYGVAMTTTWFKAEHGETHGSADLDYQSHMDLANSTSYQPITMGTGNDADQSASGVLSLFAPSNTTYVKQFYSKVAHSRFNDGTQTAYCAGYINTTSAINAVNFKFASGNVNAGAIYLCGIK